MYRNQSSQKKLHWKRVKRGAKELLIDQSSEQALRIAKARKQCSISIGEWNSSLRLVVLRVLKKKAIQTMGFTHEHTSYLFPEEALYLMERQALVIFDNYLPITIQQMYFYYMGSALTIEAYSAYAYFRRYDYLVMRSSCGFNSFNLNFKEKIESILNYKYGARDQWQSPNYHPWKKLELAPEKHPTEFITDFGTCIPLETIKHQRPHIPDNMLEYLESLDEDEECESILNPTLLNQMTKEVMCESLDLIQEVHLLDIFFKHHPIENIDKFIQDSAPSRLQNSPQWSFPPEFEFQPSQDPLLDDPQRHVTFPFTQSIENTSIAIPVSRRLIFQAPKIYWDIYPPSMTVKSRSKPGPPGFRLVVSPYRDSFPSLLEIAEMEFASFPIPVRYSIGDFGTLIHFDLIQGSIVNVGSNPYVLKSRAPKVPLQKKKRVADSNNTLEQKTDDGFFTGSISSKQSSSSTTQSSSKAQAVTVQASDDVLALFSSPMIVDEQPDAKNPDQLDQSDLQSFSFSAPVSSNPAPTEHYDDDDDDEDSYF